MPGWRTALLVAALMSVGVLAGCDVMTSSSSSAHPGASTSGHGSVAGVVGVTTYAAGSRPTLPLVTGTTLAGTHVSVASWRGHVVVLNIWASWCGPCRTESPALARAAAQTADLGVVFVGIDELDVAANARAFAAKAGTTYPQLVDADGTLLATLRIVPLSAIPSTIVIDPQGDVAIRVIGPVDPATFTAQIRRLAAGSSPAASP